MERLSSEAESGDERPVPGHVLSGQVVEQLSTTPNEPEEAHAGVGVLPVKLEMFRKLLDSSREDGYLYFH